MICPHCGKKTILDRLTCPRCGRYPYDLPTSQSAEPASLEAGLGTQPGDSSDAVHTSPKARHGCLTAWLLIMVVSNAAGLAVHTVGRAWLAKANPQVPQWANYFYMASSAVQLASAIALLSWHKWGFYALLGVSIVIAFVNLSLGYSPLMVAIGLLGVLIVFALLKQGGPRSAWSQMQ